MRGAGSIASRMWQMLDRACYCPEALPICAAGAETPNQGNFSEGTVAPIELGGSRGGILLNPRAVPGLSIYDRIPLMTMRQTVDRAIGCKR